MKKQSMIKIALVVFAMILVSGVGALAQKPDCSKTTDADIVSAVYSKIKVKYESQRQHINVRSSDGVVTIEGWATTKSVRKDIEKLAKKTSCVKSVVNTLTVGVGGGCGPGQRKCGSICIGSGATCNITP